MPSEESGPHRYIAVTAGDIRYEGLAGLIGSNLPIFTPHPHYKPNPITSSNHRGPIPTCQKSDMQDPRQEGIGGRGESKGCHGAK